VNAYNVTLADFGKITAMNISSMMRSMRSFSARLNAFN